MVSLREFLEVSTLQQQLQERLSEYVSKSHAKNPLVSVDVKEIITSCIQAALENYIAQIVIKDYKFDTPDQLREAVEEIAFYLSPESKVKIMAEASEEESYRLARSFYNLSKKQLPC